MSMCFTPNGASASTTEFTTAGEQPIVPASPTPFTPSGFTGDGVIVCELSIHGIMCALDIRHYQVRAERKREVRRLPEARRDHARLGVRRQLHRPIRRRGDLLHRSRLARFVAHHPATAKRDVLRL